MTLETAIEISVRAFSEGKSYSCPYLLDRVDGLWVMHDPPGKRYPRKTEVMSVGLRPEETVARVRKLSLGWHFLCHIHPPEESFNDIRRAYKSLGYRAIATEWVFASDLSHVPIKESEPPVRLIRTQAEFDSVKQVAARKRKFRPRWRLYGVWDDDREYGWVASVPVGENNWVFGLEVFPEYRGRGFGTALMSKLLQDDMALGVKTSVLIASSDGARLYPHLGYEKIGVLQMFCPVKRG